MTIRQAIIKKSDASYPQLKALSDLLSTQEIKNNGKIIAKCNYECDIKQARKDIRDIFNCSYSAIYFHYDE